MKDLKTLLELCFNENETVCPSDSKYAYHSMPIPSILSGEVTLVSPNPNVKIKTVKTETLTLLAINPVNGYRNDSNCTAFRTFLWEIDVGTIKSQYDYVKSLAIPISCFIFSGNKSLHFLTVLDQDLPEKVWRHMCQWALKIGTLFDENCKNPSRSVRIPGNIRPDTSKKQVLGEVNGRIKLEDFISWLKKFPDCEPKIREERKGLTGEGDYYRLSGWARSQLENGMDFTKGRNRVWFALACDLTKSGFTEEETVEILSKYYQEESDFKEKEWLITINSAYKYMENKS